MDPSDSRGQPVLEYATALPPHGRPRRPVVWTSFIAPILLLAYLFNPVGKSPAILGLVVVGGLVASLVAIIRSRRNVVGLIGAVLGLLFYMGVVWLIVYLNNAD
jgi:hypothetical protein